MIEHTQDEVVYYYYDSHPTEEDLMGETLPHAQLVHYLMEVLTWLFRDRLYVVYENFNFYQTRDKYEKPLAPDLAVIKGVTDRPVRSWRVGGDLEARPGRKTGQICGNGSASVFCLRSQ